MKINVTVNTDNEKAINKAVEMIKRIEKAYDVECTLSLNLMTRDLYNSSSSL